MAVVPARLTVTDRPLPEVSTELPLVSATLVPSKLRISLAPSVTLLTVSVIDVKVWPASIVEAVTPLKMSAAAPPSVKVGSSAVAISVGSSFTSMTVALPVLLAVFGSNWSASLMVAVLVCASGLTTVAVIGQGLRPPVLTVPTFHTPVALS